MANLYTEYNSYPGRQIRYMVVPRMYEPVFFEGVQSADFASNADEVTHGQFGTKSDVIVARDYQNTSGTFSLKEFNNASYVLRAMTGVNPSQSFLFDASRLEHVDVFGNVYNKERTQVMRSTWLVDFVPSISESESLDDIQTKDIAYTAIRKLDFEGYQIVCQTFAGDDPAWSSLSDKLAASGGGAPNGCKKFTLRYPARIDPTYDKMAVTARGMTVGIQRHELCPIQWALRVWIDGRVVEDPEEATIVTTSVDIIEGGVVTGTEYTSTLVLRDPLPGDTNVSSEHIVKVMWLVPGDEAVEQSGVTQAPVMVHAEPKLDSSNTWDSGEYLMMVDLSKYITNTATIDPNSFTLTFEDSGTTKSCKPFSVTIDTIPTNGELLASSNRLILKFAGGTGDNPGDYTSGMEASLTYTPQTGNALRDYDGHTASQHTLEITPW